MTTPYPEPLDDRPDDHKPSPNWRIRQAMIGIGITFKELAEYCGCNMKTAQRWYYEGRMPRGKHRERAAEVLRVPVSWLFPPAPSRQRTGDFCELYQRLDHMPDDVLNGLAGSAERSIAIASGSGDFLNQFALAALHHRQTSPVRILATHGSRWKAGQPLSHRVWIRRTRAPGIGSLLWADDAMLVVPSLLGNESLQGPVMLVLRRELHGMFDTYVDRFEQLWTDAAARVSTRAELAGSARSASAQ